jgi:hypothetical protein
MADFAIGGSFHKASRTLIRAIPLTLPNRYYAVRDAAGMITLPTLVTGDSYIEMQGMTKFSFKVDANDNEFRLFGDDGWADSVTTGGKVSASYESYFMRNIELPGGAAAPDFRGNYSEDFAIIERSRSDLDFEVYIELLKEMGRANSATGNFIYDYAGFNGVFRGYSDGGDSQGLSTISGEFMSRGRPVFGRYDSGSTPLSIGALQSSQLSTANTSGTRRWAVVPLDNASAVVVSSAITITYTTDGTTALTQLSLPPAGGGGFRVENASSGVQISAGVALGGGSSNVITITPTASLPAATILRLRVADGAINQSLDASGNPSASGIRRPLQGFSTTFRTA